MRRKPQNNISSHVTEGWRLVLVHHIIKYFELDARLPNPLLIVLHLLWYTLSGIWSSDLDLLDSLTMDKTYDATEAFGPFVCLGCLLLVAALFALSLARHATDTRLYKAAYLLLLLFRYAVYPYAVMLTGAFFGRILFKGASMSPASAAVLLATTVVGLACVLVSLLVRNTFPSGTGQATTSLRDSAKYVCITLSTFIGALVHSAPHGNVLALVLKLLSCLILAVGFAMGYGAQIYWNQSLNPISSFGMSFVLCSTLISTTFRALGYSKGTIIFVLIFVSILWKSKLNLKLTSLSKIFAQQGFEKGRTMFKIIWELNFDLTTQDPKDLHGHFLYQHLFKSSNDPLEALISLLSTAKDLKSEGQRLLAFCLIFQLPKGLYTAKKGIDLLQKGRDSGFMMDLECHHLQLLIERRLALSMNHAGESESLPIREVYRKSFQAISSSQDYLKLEHPLNCESEHKEMTATVLKLLELKQEMYGYLQSDHLISMKKLFGINSQLNSMKAFLRRRFVAMSERPDSAPFQLCVAFAFIGKVTYDLNLGHRLFKIFRTRTEVINREVNRMSVSFQKVTSTDELFLGVSATSSLQESQLGKITDVTSNSKDIFGCGKKEVIGKNINSLFAEFLQPTHLDLMRNVSQKTFTYPRHFTICGFDSDMRQVVANLGLIANVTKDIASVAVMWNKTKYEYHCALFDQNYFFAASEKPFKKLLLDYGLSISSGMKLYHLSSSLYKYILLSKINDEISRQSFGYTTPQQDEVIRILGDFIQKGRDLISYSATYLRTKTQDVRLLARFHHGKFASKGYLIVEVKELTEATVRPSVSGKTMKISEEMESEPESEQESLQWKDVGSEQKTIEDLAHETNSLLQQTFPKDQRERKELLKKSNGDSELKRTLRYLTKVFGFKEEKSQVLSDFLEGDLKREKDHSPSSRKWDQTKQEITESKVYEPKPNFELRPTIISDIQPKKSFNTIESDQFFRRPGTKDREPKGTKELDRSGVQPALKAHASSPYNPCLQPLKSNMLTDEKGLKSLDSASLKIAGGRREKEANEKGDEGLEENALMGSQSSKGKKKNSVTVYGQIQGIITRPMNYAHSNRLVVFALISLFILVLFMSLIHQTTINTQAKNFVDFNFLTIKASNDNSLRKLLTIQMPVYELLKRFWSDEDPNVIYAIYAKLGTPTPMLTFLQQLEASVEDMRENLVSSQIELNSKLKGTEGLQLVENQRIDFEIQQWNRFNQKTGEPVKIANVNKLFEYFLSEFAHIGRSTREIYLLLSAAPYVYPRTFDAVTQAKIDGLELAVTSLYKNMFEGYFAIDEGLYQKISASVVDTSFEAYVAIGTTLLGLFGGLMLIVVVLLWTFVYRWVNTIYAMVAAYTELKPNELRVQLEVLGIEKDLFERHSMNQGMLSGVLFNLNSEDFRNKVEDNLRGGEKRESQNGGAKKKSQREHIIRRTKTLQRNHTFRGAVGMVLAGLFALFVYTIFTVSVVFVVRESGKKIEIERFYSKNVELFHDLSNYFLTNMALFSDGNYYKFKGRFVEDVELSHSVDAYIRFWNSKIADFGPTFDTRTEDIKKMVFGDVCSFITLRDKADPTAAIQRCRGYLNGAAGNGGILGYLIYLKEFTGRYRHNLQTQFPGFLATSKTRTVDALPRIYFSEEYLSARILFRSIADIINDQMTPIFTERVKAFEAGELVIMTWKLALAGIVGVAGLLIAVLSFKKLRRDTRLGYETMRNICPYIVVNNALILNKYKHSFDAQII